MKYWPVLVLLFFFISCESEVKKISEQEALTLSNKELLKNVDLNYTDSGKVVMNIKAPEMLRSQVNNQAQDEFKKGLKASFYSRGILSNNLVSNYAIRILSEGKTYLYDHVLLTNPKGEKLETSELIWDERNGRVTTDKFVRLSRSSEIVQGYGFDADQNFQKGTIKSIEATFPVSKIMSEDLDEK
ncbi:MAG: LPS export ABC transporter periplasmic protein LptC [Saprospiraceae bacterium]